MTDRVKIYVKAGNGGNGCNSFKGVKFTRSRHPDGGPGGRGGDVIIKVDPNIRSLAKYQFKQHFQAEAGQNGQANKKKGADGRPCIIKVPPGTIVRDLDSDLFLGDLVDLDVELPVARGGEGGKANAKKRPATQGAPAEEKTLLLELRLVADLGLIGYPNSGKSSLMHKISSAKPKVASYPFTTTAPFLSTIVFSDFAAPEALTIVEMPGLTQGANQGKGLGAEFLRHIERAKVLVHLIDMAACEGRDPFADFRNVTEELRLFDRELARKPQILVANKMDLPRAETNLQHFSKQIKQDCLGTQIVFNRIYPVSALTGLGIEKLISQIKSYFKEKMI